MSYLLPLSSCSTPGWNDPPAVLDPTKTSSSPSTGALANRHRRPVHPSIQVLLLGFFKFRTELFVQKYSSHITSAIVHSSYSFLFRSLYFLRSKFQTRKSLLLFIRTSLTTLLSDYKRIRALYCNKKCFLKKDCNTCCHY